MPTSGSLQAQRPLQFVAIVHLDQNVQAVSLGHRRQLMHPRIVQCRNDQQDAVGAKCARSTT